MSVFWGAALRIAMKYKYNFNQKISLGGIFESWLTGTSQPIFAEGISQNVMQRIMMCAANVDDDEANMLKHLLETIVSYGKQDE